MRKQLWPHYRRLLTEKSSRGKVSTRRPQWARCRCPTQTRDHLFKVCPDWKAQQKILWAEVRKEFWEVEEPVEDPGSTCRWEVWSGGDGFPFFY